MTSVAVKRVFEVDAPLEEAWQRLAEVERWPEWAPHIISVTVSPPGELGPTSSGALQIKWLGRNTFRMSVWGAARALGVGRRAAWGPHRLRPSVRVVGPGSDPAGADDHLWVQQRNERIQVTVGRTGVLDAHVALLEVRYPGREVWRVVVSASRSVAVLGPIPRDRIITHRGEVLEKYGCALYTVAALSALLDADDRIYPIVHVRREDEEPIKELLSAFPNVDLTGVRSASDHGAVVELSYVDQNTRIEQQIGFMDPITPADVEFALHADAFVCVPITDYEVGQATLAYIKEHSAGTILLDAHGPTSTLVIGGERRRRLWVERDSWLPHIDLLKMNLEEAGCSWFPSKIALEHHDAGAPITTEALPEFAAHCLGHGVTAVCVT